MIDRKAIAKRIRIALIERDMTITDLHRQSGINRMTLYGIVQRCKGMMAETAYKICATLNVSFEWLMTGRDEPKESK